MDETRIDKLRRTLDKARITEAVARALLIVAQSDYERARDARSKLETERHWVEQNKSEAA